jgi:large subunit ribosomal protein L25
MEEKLTASPREKTGKEYAKKLRNQGKIPAILYGHRFQPLPICIEEKSFRTLLRKEKGLHGLLQLEVEGVEDGKHTVVVKEVQKDPIKDIILHVDFQKIRLDEEITAEVPLRFVGEPVGVKAGGILQHFLYEISVQCLPVDLPEEITVDVSHLDVRDNLRVEDLPEVKGIKYLNKPEEVVAAVAPKKVKEAAVAVEGEEAEEEAAAAPAGAEEGGGEEGTS